MKKRLLLLILLLTGILCLTGCEETQSKEVNASEQGETKVSDDQDEEESEDKDDQDQSGSEDPNEEENQSEDQADAQSESDDANELHSSDITVYYCNNDATGFDSEEVLLGSFSAENVLNALMDKGVVTADVKILSLEVTEVDGKDTLEVDFNNAFASYISSKGSTGEYYTMGAVCNTLLEAYDCEQIKITVEGGTLETGHAEYPGYMTLFS